MLRLQRQRSPTNRVLLLMSQYWKHYRQRRTLKNQNKCNRYRNELDNLSARLSHLGLGRLLPMPYSLNGTQVLRLHRRWVWLVKLLRCRQPVARLQQSKLLH
jgi:hypothetical protein